MRSIIFLLIASLLSVASGVEVPFRSIDLRSSATMGFSDKKADDKTGGWTDQGPTNDLRVLKSGMLKYNGIPFEIINPAKNKGKSCIALRGKYRSYFPLESDIIKVDSKGDMIYFLGACAWSASIGEDVFRIIVEYDERSAYCETEFRFGEHIGGWWGPAPLPLADVGWEASNGSAEVGLYCFAWKNPYPKENIKHIKFVSSDSQAVPIIVAATLVQKSETSKKLLAELKKREDKFRSGSDNISSVNVSIDLSKPFRSIPPAVASVSNGRTINPAYIPQGNKLAYATDTRPFYRIQTHSTEPSVSRGVYDFSKLDGVLDYIDALGFRPMVCISKGPKWIAKKAPDGKPLKRWIPGDKDEYVKYCEEVVRHCTARKNPVLWYEIGNEPDLKGWSYKLYIKLFKAVSPKLRAIDSRIKLGGPVTCGPNIGWAKLLVENAYDEVDFISYHKYGYSEDFNSPDKHIMGRLSLYESSARKYKKMLQEQKKDCLIFLTEANTSWRFPKTDPRIRNQFGAAWTASAVGNYLKGGGDIFHFFTYNGGFGMTWVFREGPMLFPVYHSYWMLRKFFSGQMVMASNQQKDVINSYGYINPREAGAFVINITDRPIDVDLQLRNNPSDPKQVLSYALNEKTWQPLRTVSEDGVVPLLSPSQAKLQSDGKFKIKLAPYEVRLIRLLNKAENTELLKLSIEDTQENKPVVKKSSNLKKRTREFVVKEPANNLLPNFSAEKACDVISEMPANWSLHPADANGKWDDKVSRSGGKSLRIDSSDKHGTSWFSDLFTAVKPGETLELQGYIKTEKGWGNNEIKLVWFDADNKWISTSRSKTVNGTKDWTHVKLTAEAPKRAAIAKVFVGRRYGTDKGLSWFDDITLTKPGQAKTESQSVEKSADNLLENASFEQTGTDSQTPSQWRKYPRNAVVELDSSTARSGGKSVRIDSSGKNGAYLISDSAINVTPDETFDVKGYIKTSNGWGDNVIKLVWYDASKKWISSSYTKAVNGTKDWTQVRVVAAAPKRAAVLKVFVGRRYGTNKGVSWFDDITLTRAGAKNANAQVNVKKKETKKVTAHSPITLRSGKMAVRLQPSRAWTIDLFSYNGKTLSTPVGNNGVAIDFGKNEWVGGNHKEGGREQVLETKLTVDGQPVSIPPRGTLKGESIVFSKRSILRDIELEMRIEVLADRVVEEHNFKVINDTYVRRLMAFMHCWKLSTSEYVAKLLNGQTERGQIDSSGGYLLEDDITDAAVFDSDANMALVTSFDSANPLGQGMKHTFWNLDKYYHKQYFQAIDKKDLTKGTELNFKVTFRPVEVTTTDWVDSVEF